MNNHEVNICVTITQVMAWSIFSSPGAPVSFPDPTYSPTILGLWHLLPGFPS